jgi:hypothetical protein
VPRRSAFPLTRVPRRRWSGRPPWSERARFSNLLHVLRRASGAVWFDIVRPVPVSSVTHPIGKTYFSLILRGETLAEVAARFGVTPQAVGQAIRYYRSATYRTEVRARQKQQYRTNPAYSLKAAKRYARRREGAA